jgi:hypothetical protein
MDEPLHALHLIFMKICSVVFASFKKIPYSLATFDSDTSVAKHNIYSGVEERYLGRLITSRPRFDSGPRNIKKSPCHSWHGFFFTGAKAREQNALLSSGSNKRRYVA